MQRAAASVQLVQAQAAYKSEVVRQLKEGGSQVFLLLLSCFTMYAALQGNLMLYTSLLEGEST